MARRNTPGKKQTTQRETITDMLARLERERIDVQVRYVIETPDGNARGEYAGVFNTANQANDALQTWSRFAGVRGAEIRARILPTIVVTDNGQSLQFVGGSF